MRARRRERGYTIVELLMSLVVLAIGTSGVIAMQKITLRSNSHAKNLAVATRIASAWADALAADASLWNSSADLSETTWLSKVTDKDYTWIRPTYSAARRFGAGFGPLGNALPDTDSALARYCTDVRLTWLAAGMPAGNALTDANNGLIRAEIRVFWKRDAAVTTSTLPADICNEASNTPVNLTTADAADGYHIVYLTTALAMTPTGGGS